MVTYNSSWRPNGRAPYQTFIPLTGGCSECLDAFRFFFKNKTTHAGGTIKLYLTRQKVIFLFKLFFLRAMVVFYLKEPSTSMGPEPAMDYVRCAVWGMLYADDACIVSRSPQGLAKMMEVIVEVCRAFALTVSAKKTETMCMPPPRTPRTMVRIEAAGQIYKQVQSFTYDT